MINPSSSVIIIFLGFAGFAIAFYIRHHKKNVKEALICPLRANCDTVIHSDYSKFLGIPVEILGLFYYGLVSLTYGLFVVVPETSTPLVVFLIHFASASAFFILPLSDISPGFCHQKLVHLVPYLGRNLGFNFPHLCV